MAGHKGKSGRKQEQAIAALLQCETIRAAAKQCGVAESTIQRWLREDAAFQSAYAKAKRDLLSATINRLLIGGVDAARRLHGIVNDKDAPPAVVVSASVRHIALMLEASKFDDLSTRLDKLEQLIEKGDS